VEKEKKNPRRYDYLNHIIGEGVNKSKGKKPAEGRPPQKEKTGNSQEEN